MKKRIGSLLLSLALCLTLLPTAAVAADDVVKIGDTSLSVGAFYANDGSAGPSNWNAKLEKRDNKLTLTLKGLNYSGSNGIKYENTEDLYIVLEGENTITATNSEGINTSSSLYISAGSSGRAKLTIKSTNGCGILAYRVHGYQDHITIENVELTVTAEGSNYYGVAGIVADKNVTIKDSTVTVTGVKYGIQDGLYAQSSGAGNLTITNSTVKAIATADDGKVFRNAYPKMYGGYRWKTIASGNFTDSIDGAADFTGRYLELLPPKPTAAKPEAVFNATDTNAGTLSNVKSGMEYSLYGSNAYNWTTIDGTSVELTGVTTHYGICVRQPRTDDKLASDVQKINVTQPTKPIGLSVVACTSDSHNDGKITGVTTGMEYRKDGVSSWTTCTGTEITGLEAGKYYIRYKANGTQLASESGWVTVKSPMCTIVYDGTTTPVTAPKVGDTLKAKVTNAPVGANLTYQWYYVDGETNAFIEGATNQTYALQETSKDQYIGVFVYNGTYDATNNYRPICEDWFTIVVAPASGTPATVTVSFNTNCTDTTVTTPASKSVVKDTGTISALPTLTREGFTFGGWYQDAACTEANKVTTATTFSTDTTLYAKWTANPSAPTTGTMSFTNAYDVQRHKTNGIVELSAFQKPINTTYSDLFESAAGNWTLTHVGTFESYTGKPLDDTQLGYIAADVKDVYSLDDVKDVPIYQLKLDNTHVTYGVVQAQGKVYDNNSLSGAPTDTNGVLFVSASDFGYFLTNEGSLIGSGSGRYMALSIDTSGTTTPTPSVTITYTDGSHVSAPKVGDTLKANVTGVSDSETLTYKWLYVKDNNTLESLGDSDTVAATYTVKAADEGKTIGVKVTVAGNRPIWVELSAPVAAASSSPSTSGGSSGGSSNRTGTIPISSDSASVNVKVEVSRGNATASVSDAQIEKVAADGAGDVTIDVSGLKNVDSATVPSRVIEKTNEAENTGLTVALPNGSVTLDEAALESVTDNANGEDVTVSVVAVPTADLSPAVKDSIGMEPTVVAVVDVNVTVNGVKQSSFDGGKVTISIPYTPKEGEDTSKLTVWFIRDDGTIENKGGWYDEKNKCFVFETDHLSQYLLVNTDELVSFTDVPADSYFASAVLWAVKQGITGGVSETAFAPYRSCTRAQLVTFLYRWAVANGADVNVGEDTNILSYNDAFDVPEYAISAFQWAVGAGIVQGNNGDLLPNQTCTRAQAVTFLFRYAAANGMDFVTLQELVSGYSDAAQVPGYALSAFNWALAGGIVAGNNGSLMPNNDCTRAQIVTMLYRLLGE